MDNHIATTTHAFGWSGSIYEPETDLYWMRNLLISSILKKILKQELTDEDRMSVYGGPVVNDPDIKTGLGSFMFNPLYKSKDPMQQIFRERTDTGMTIQHNPLAPKPELELGYNPAVGGYVLGNEGPVLYYPEVDP